MVVGRDLVVGRMKGASAIQLRFAISLVGGRTKKTKYLAVYICLLYKHLTQREPTTSEASRF
jgi:hypothetical protein